MHAGKLNSADFGVAQARARLFVVSIRRDSVKHKFSWPQKRKAVALSSVLDPRRPQDKPGRLPSSARGKDRCKAAFSKAMKDFGADPMKIPIAVDVDCSRKFSTFGVNRAKTITKTRGTTGGPWISTRGRRTTTAELMRLQGLRPEDIPYNELGVTTRQVGALVGNAATVNTIGCLLRRRYGLRASRQARLHSRHES